MSLSPALSAPPWAVYLDQIPLADEQSLTTKQTLELVGIGSDMQLGRMERRGDFPGRYKLNPAVAEVPNAAVGHSKRNVLAWVLWRLASASA